MREEERLPARSSEPRRGCNVARPAGLQDDAGALPRFRQARRSPPLGGLLFAHCPAASYAGANRSIPYIVHGGFRYEFVVPRPPDRRRMPETWTRKGGSNATA
jgi:hypothetical protein